MPGRLVQIFTWQQLFDHYRIQSPLPSEAREPRYNLSPTANIVVLRPAEDTSLQARMMYWSLIPSRARDLKFKIRTHNARAEGLATSEVYQGAYSERRCLIPANALYEWLHAEEDPATKKPKHPAQPHLIRREDGQLMTMAGLWQAWTSPDGKTIKSTTLITCDANDFVTEIDDRMPCLLEREEWNAWLDSNSDHETLARLLVPREWTGMVMYRVHPRVSSGRAEGPECIEPYNPEAESDPESQQLELL